MVAVPRVALATLDTQMLVFALITETTSTGAIVERTAARAIVLERVDFGPLLGGDASVPSWFALALSASLGLMRAGLELLELLFLPSAPQLVLASLG